MSIMNPYVTYRAKLFEDIIVQGYSMCSYKQQWLYKLYFKISKSELDKVILCYYFVFIVP